MAADISEHVLCLTAGITDSGVTARARPPADGRGAD